MKKVKKEIPLDKINDYKSFLLSQYQLIGTDPSTDEKHYISISIERYMLYLAILDNLLENNEIPSCGLKVLDVGCYPGHMALILRRYYNAKVYAVGITNNKIFEERMASNGIEFYLVNIEKDKLPFSDNNFDLILFTEVIEHLFNPFLIGSEISRLLKPAGILLLSTINLASLRNRIHFIQGKMVNETFLTLVNILSNTESLANYEYHAHIRLWLPVEIRIYLNKYRFIVKDEYYQNFPEVDRASLRERLLRLFINLFPVSFRDTVVMVARKTSIA